MDGKEQEMEDMDRSPFREDQAFTKKIIKPKIMRCFTLLTCVPTIDHMFPSFRVLYLLCFGLVFFFGGYSCGGNQTNILPILPLHQAAAP